MSAEPLTACEACGAPVERVFHPVAVHFKGSGFYTTDYGARAKSGQDGATKEAEKPADKKDSKGKSEAKAES